MKFFYLFFLLICFSSPAFAGSWIMGPSVGFNRYQSTYSTLPEYKNYLYSSVTSSFSSHPHSESPYYITDNARCDDSCDGSGPNIVYGSATITYYSSDSGQLPDTSTHPGVLFYNLIYTDEQCQAQYGTATVPISSDDWFPDTFDAGACSLTPIPGTGFCSLITGQCTGDFTATSTGNTNTPGQTGASDPDTPEYLTETDDPDSCSGGSVAYGGTSYCVDQSAIDDGLVNIIGGDDSGSDGGSGSSGGIDWGDAPDDGSTPGTSTGSDGNPLGMGEGDPDGDGEGDSTLGDVVAAINGLKDIVRTGFDSVYEKTVQFVEDLSKGPTQAQIEAEFGTAEENQTAMEAAITEAGGELTSLIDGSDSQFTDAYDTMGSFFGTYFPTIPDPSCSPLVFAAGEPYSFTIECDVFQLIREALAWILYAFTVYVIIATMFSARPH